MPETVTQAPEVKADTAVVYGYVTFVRYQGESYALDCGIRPDGSEFAMTAFQVGLPLSKTLSAMILAKVAEALQWAQVTNTLADGEDSSAMRETRTFVAEKAVAINAALNQLNTLAVEVSTSL